MALITQAQVEKIFEAADVTAFTGGNSTVIAELLDEASDWCQEYATAAGVTLTAGSLTASMRRRIAIRFLYTAATRKKEIRDDQGRAPYHVEHAQAEAELHAWADRLRSLSNDTVSEAPVVLSEDPRGWNADT